MYGLYEQEGLLDMCLYLLTKIMLLNCITAVLPGYRHKGTVKACLIIVKEKKWDVIGSK